MVNNLAPLNDSNVVCLPAWLVLCNVVSDLLHCVSFVVTRFRVVSLFVCIYVCYTCYLQRYVIEQDSHLNTTGYRKTAPDRSLYRVLLNQYVKDRVLLLFLLLSARLP